MCKSLIQFLCLSASLATISGCKAAGGKAADGLVSLADSIDPFRERFNVASHKPRFVAILSSTCGPCVSGAVAVNETIVKGFADAGIDVSIVWIDVLPTDGAASAERASVIFKDKRVTQYHDPTRLLGNAFAEGLVKKPPAWDIYLFYSTGVRWEEAPPVPVDWRHQLGGEVAEASRFKTGVALAADLHAAMERLGYASNQPTPHKDQLVKAKAAATERIAEAARRTGETGREQCSRCAASGTIGQCSISGWRYVVARRVRDDGGNLTDHFEMSGGPQRPVGLDGINPEDTRHLYAVEGMACPNCVISVAGHALMVEGVTRVEIDYDTRRLIVYTNPKSGSNLETMPAHLEAVGYRVAPLVSEPD